MSERSLLSSLGGLASLALAKKPGLAAGASIPLIEVAEAVRVDAAWLRRYRASTGSFDDGALPPCAPQVLAIALHVRLLRDERFPLPAMGMVHIENVIEERSPIAADTTLALTARVVGHVPHDKGVAFQIVTEAKVGGDVPWRSTMTALVRGPATAEQKPKSGERAVSTRRAVLSSSVLRVPEATGRRYAAVAGDANPIHLSALTARPFGFPRAIAHGMWTLARALAEVDGALPSRPRRIDVRFIRPVLLPSSVVVEAVAAAGGVELSVTPERKGPPHVLGTVTPLAPADH